MQQRVFRASGAPSIVVGLAMGCASAFMIWDLISAIVALSAVFWLINGIWRSVAPLVIFESDFLIVDRGLLIPRRVIGYASLSSVEDRGRCLRLVYESIAGAVCVRLPLAGVGEPDAMKLLGVLEQLARHSVATR